MHLRFTTAGESHGPGLIAVIEGVPAGLQLSPSDIDDDLARRQLGHGRGGRMKIEQDRATVVSGIRHGRTLGSPIALSIANRDYANWEERMNPWPVEADVAEVHLPRPGHADLAGVQKFGHDDCAMCLSGQAPVKPLPVWRRERSPKPFCESSALRFAVTSLASAPLTCRRLTRRSSFPISTVSTSRRCVASTNRPNA